MEYAWKTQMHAAFAQKKGILNRQLLPIQNFDERFVMVTNASSFPERAMQAQKEGSWKVHVIQLARRTKNTTGTIYTAREEKA